MGILLRLADGAVGFVARKRLDMLSLDDVPSKCRILDYRHLEQLYICSFDTDAPDKTDETDNLKIGQTVRATISGINSKGIALKLGKVGGFIQNVHLADEPYDNEVKERFKVGDVISAKVWNINEGGVYFTCKEALLDKEVGPMSLEDFEINKPYPGVVVNKSKKGIMVVFFGDVRGILFKDYLNRIFGNQWQDAMYEGEVVLPVVEKMENGILRLKFSVPEVHSVARPLNVGEYVAAQVTQNIPQGLHITIPRKNQKGFIPVAHLSCSLSLTPQLLDTYNVGDDLDDLMCVSADDKTFSIREGRRFKLRGAQVPSSSDVRVGSLLRCSYLKSYNQRVCVSALVAPKPMVLNLYNNEMDVESNRKFASQQGITVRVTRINNDRKRIKVSARTTDVYDWSLEDAVYELEQYLSDIRRIQDRSSHVTKCCLGQQVDCTVKTVAKDYATVTVEGDVEGIVVKHHCLAKMEVGAEVRGLVLWVDVQKNLMIISLKMDQLNFKHDSKAHLNTSTEASVLYFNDDFAMVITKSNHAVFIPMLSNNKFLMVGQYKPNQKVNVIVKRIVNGMAVGIDEAIFKRFSSKQKVAPSVEKVIKSEDEEPVDGNVSSLEEESNNDEKEISPANENSQRKTVAPTLPGLDNFFSAPKVVESESSSDEEVPRERKSKKKKKLTAAERTEMIRHNEEKIRAKEIELADASLEPDSEERFERLVAGNPNSSELWAKYIAYCVSNAEIQKARTIARHALKRIDLNETVERYNVWITLLNLENSYGDKDSFNAAFEEAARCNDDLQIYLDVIDLFANSKRYSEMNEKIKKMKTKHKTDPKMWTGIARVYYKCGHLQDARNVHSSALKTVHSKADHVDLVVQFAVMEFKYGEKHHAEALFETVLQENPKRVDVWSTYVDQMVKKDNIEGARRVLERAVCNSIPPKKMKILFKKFKELELKFGNEESVQHVIELAKQYLGNKL
ncbi:protein RRP5 homolog [Photinus pyralis]|uniref:protein RRP5 homolog n=1 Tax=Photinus pyralis TaxID=7054 RepID=UPI00126782CA|nr:protein RRP5 homolog [Photinus pyralis]